MSKKSFWKDGVFFPDDTQVAVPLAFKRPPSLREEVQRFIREDASRAAHESGYESFDEANDFEVGDDFSAEEYSEHEDHDFQERMYADDREAARRGPQPGVEVGGSGPPGPAPGQAPAAAPPPAPGGPSSSPNNPPPPSVSASDSKT